MTEKGRNETLKKWMNEYDKSNSSETKKNPQKMKIKYILFLPFLIMISCVSYRYDFDENENIIISKKTNIQSINIYTKDFNELVYFTPKTNKQSKTFSIESFSPDFFDCSNISPFYFKKMTKYYIKIYPQGDIVQSDFIVILDNKGKVKLYR